MGAAPYYIEGLREFLTSKFKTDFLAQFPTAKIRYENVKYENQEGLTSPVVYIRDEPVIRAQRAIGLNDLRLEGLFHIEAVTPEDTGTKQIREYVDYGTSIFEGLDYHIPNIGYIRTKEITYNQLSMYRGLYTISAVIRYQCDLCE